MSIISGIEVYVWTFCVIHCGSERDENTHKFESSSASVDLEGTTLNKGEKMKFKQFLD